MGEAHGRANGQYDEPPEWFKQAQRRSGPSRFMDGCHRYGFILSPILSALFSLAMFAYYAGGVNSNIDALKADVQLLKQQVFSLAHLTRGTEEINDGQHR